MENLCRIGRAQHHIGRAQHQAQGAQHQAQGAQHLQHSATVEELSALSALATLEEFSADKAHHPSHHLPLALGLRSVEELSEIAQHPIFLLQALQAAFGLHATSSACVLPNGLRGTAVGTASRSCMGTALALELFSAKCAEAAEAGEPAGEAWSEVALVEVSLE